MAILRSGAPLSPAAQTVAMFRATERKAQPVQLDLSTAATQRRIGRLEAAGWRRAGSGWELTVDDPRWSVFGGRLEATGSTFEEATYSAYRMQLEREAEEIRRRQLASERS